MSKSNPQTRLTNLSVTIYSGSALVQGKYAVELVKGRNKFQLFGLPAQLDPRSIKVDNFEGPGNVTLGPISYRPANLTSEAMVARALSDGQKVTVRFGGATKKEQQEKRGKLVNVAGNVVLLKVKGGKIEQLRNVQGFTFDGIPEGLDNTASASLTVDAEAEGAYEITLVYRANYLSWEAQHNWTVDEKTGKVNWDASVFVGNNSGVTYNEASLKVVAGDVGTAGMPEAMPMAAMASLESAPAGGARAASVKSRNVRQAQAQNLGQVKVFTIPGASTVEQGESQKIPFFAAEDVPVTREYRVRPNYAWHARGDRHEQPVRTIFVFKNNADNKLGTPLPSGPVVLMQRDSSGALLENGGGHIGDVAVGEQVSLDTGSDFDLKATRIVSHVDRTEHPLPVKQEQPANFVEEGGLPIGPSMTSARMPAHQPQAAKPVRKVRVHLDKQCCIELFNGKSEPVEFIVEESLTDDCSFQGKHGLTQVTAGQWEQRLTVEPGQTGKLEYVIRQTSVEEVDEDDQE